MFPSINSKSALVNPARSKVLEVELEPKSHSPIITELTDYHGKMSTNQIIIIRINIQPAKRGAGTPPPGKDN